LPIYRFIGDERLEGLPESALRRMRLAVRAVIDAPYAALRHGMRDLFQELGIAA